MVTGQAGVLDGKPVRKFTRMPGKLEACALRNARQAQRLSILQVDHCWEVRASGRKKSEAANHTPREL